ncbi:50S ribosomal protein L11 methyltransferase [Arcticibacter sp. MXS-1]|uniref:50S ribosomal protein L11 methyltransferase n=1 Tax=Arcticibacter sp. MXS-1 TaxID=3341726 RepID=UPI0035A9AB74
MDYYEFSFKVTTEEDYQRDLLLQAIAEAGFDTFEETPEGFNAYISQSAYDRDLLEKALTPFYAMFRFSYEQKLIPKKNWNEVWESNFEPITIDNKCFVRATFHEPRPEFPIEIVIDPRMSFGTGHHQTTAMMIRFLLEDSMQDKRVLDMGCGTGILAILARKLGASEVTAIDYDPVCYESAIENAALNETDGIQVLCGSKEAIPHATFDVIIANINRNILLDQISRYAEAMAAGGILYLSGFYNEDCAALMEEAGRYSFSFLDKKEQDNWAALKLLKA